VIQPPEDASHFQELFAILCWTHGACVPRDTVIWAQVSSDLSNALL